LAIHEKTVAAGEGNLATDDGTNRTERAYPWIRRLSTMVLG
jgi:hypothetical protein